MKIIDRRGKLFGLINIVDLLVLILIIGFISVVVVRFNSQRLNANGGNPLTEKEDVYVTLYASLVVPEIAENLQIGDKLVANSAYTSAEIVDIKVEPAAYVSTNADGEAVLSEHPLWKDVTVVIKDTVNPSSVILKAASQEVRVGYSFILKTQTVETNTKIRGVEFGSYTPLDSSEEVTYEDTEENATEDEETATEDLEENTTSSIENNSQSTTVSTTSSNQATNTQTTTTQTTSSQATNAQTSSSQATNTQASSSNQTATTSASSNQDNTTQASSSNQDNTTSDENNTSTPSTSEETINTDEETTTQTEISTQTSSNTEDADTDLNTDTEEDLITEE